MSSRETQRLILDSALRLFNEHGSPNVSTNRIAEDCGISKGNLNYHFRTKQEIVLTLFWQMSQETMTDAGSESATPPERFASLFARQIGNSWRYRFFIRESAALLREQSVLRRRFGELRRRNEGEWRRALADLVQAGLMHPLPGDAELELLLANIFIHGDHWLQHLETQDAEIDAAAFARGYEALLVMLGTCLTGSGAAMLRAQPLIDQQCAHFLPYIAPPVMAPRQRTPMSA